MFCLLVLFAGLTTKTVRSEEGLPIIRTYSAKDTGAVAECWTTTQDERGMLYFGTDVVVTFDGDHWRQYPAGGSHTIRGLAVDATGRLWIGAIGEIGYFDRLPSGDLSNYHSLVPKLPSDFPTLGDVWHVFVTSDGIVFITDKSVLVWNGSAFRIHSLPGSRRLPAVLIDGKVYVHHLTKGWHSLEPDGLRPFISADRLDHKASLFLAPVPTGWLVAGSEFVGIISATKITPYGDDVSQFLRQRTLSAACLLPNGNLCLGTLEGGIGIFDDQGRSKQMLRPANGLTTVRIFSFFVARDGALWITSPSGIQRLETAAASSRFDQRNGLAGKRCTGFGFVDDQLFVATDDRVSRLSIQAAPAGIFTAAFDLTCSSMLSSGNDLFLGAFNRLERWRNNERIAFFPANRSVLSIAPSIRVPGRLFISENLELRRLDPSGNTYTATTLATLPDFPETAVEDDAGTVWLGTQSRGVLSLKDAPGSQPRELKPGIPHDAKNRGAVGRVGDAIALCTQQGIELRFDPRADTAVPVSDAPTSGPIHMSNPDPQGRAWIVFNGPFADSPQVGIVGRLSVDASHQGHWESFAIPGLAQIDRVNRLFVDPRGVLWIGGYDGLLRVEPDKLKPVAPPAQPLLIASVADGGELRYGDNAVTFAFGSVEFAQRESVRFQTRLSGSDDAWSAPTNRDQLTLARLRDGDYALSLRVINDAGLTSPETTWRFTILPPWYRTKFAYAGWTILALGSVFGFVSWRSGYLRRQNVRLEELVARKTAELEKANAAKSEFLANMSHEIRNPISGIVGLSLAMEETALDLRQKSLTDSIRSCATLLATLVDDVLDFSKIEAGKIELRVAPFELRPTLAQCADMVKESLRASGTSLALDIAPEVPAWVAGDSSRVQQIVLNYLTNAVKFGGAQPVTLGATAAGRDRIRFFVRDRGPGLTKADAASLFTKFSRLSRAQAENIRGTGLGLAVCRLLAEKMDGQVGVDSQPGEGSCFWAELPLAATDPNAPATPLSPPVSPLRALIVEDIAYNATAMQAVLRKFGIASDVASDGPAALAQLQRQFYDVAFMDWNLPGMIGTEVVARFRAVEPPDRRTIIIATTAYSADFNREACLQAGMDAFIAKPFTPEKISLALQDLRGSLRAAASIEIRPVREIAPPLPGLDLEMLRILADDATGGLRPQIERYLAAVDADRLAIAESIARGDPKDIHRFAHRLVSHAGMIDYEPLRRIAADLQARAATSEPNRLLRLLDDYDREFSQLRKRLASICPPAAPA